MISLYVHTPFCVKKCYYCNFVTSSFQTDWRQERFLAALEKQAQYYETRLSDRVLETVYIGGGTPSCLLPEYTRRLFELIHRYFKVDPAAEVTFEVNPGDLDPAKTHLYKQLGITRISLGVQSFNDRLLKKLNRPHDVKAIFESYDLLRKEGFKNINFDLMLSLPGQSLGEFKKTTLRALSLGPEHVSLYELVVEPKTAFGNWKAKGLLRLPTEEAQIAMLLFARQTLQKRGFVHYELLNYAKQGFEARHNLVYWANEEYLGLGPSATSYLNGRRFVTAKDFDEYLTKADSGHWKPYEEEMLDPEKRRLESFLLALRLKRGVRVESCQEVIRQKACELKDLMQKRLLDRRDGFIRLTPKGQLFAESVFVSLS